MNKEHLGKKFIKEAMDKLIEDGVLPNVSYSIVTPGLQESLERYNESVERCKMMLANPFSIVHDFDRWFRYQLTIETNRVRAERLIKDLPTWVASLLRY